MISVINDIAIDIEVVERAIIGIKVESSLSSEISMVEQKYYR